MTIFTTYNNGVFSASNGNNNAVDDDDADDDEKKFSHEIWKEIKVNENQIWFLLMPLIFLKCLCEGSYWVHFAFLFGYFAFNATSNRNRNYAMNGGIRILCHFFSAGFDSIFFPCATAALYIVLHLDQCGIHKHKHTDVGDIHATYILYWNVYV